MQGSQGWAETTEQGREPKQLPCNRSKSRTEQSVVARIDLAKTIRRVTLDGSRRTVKQVKSSCHPIHTTVGERDPLCQLIGTLRQSRSMTITEAQSGAESRLRAARMSSTYIKPEWRTRTRRLSKRSKSPGARQVKLEALAPKLRVRHWKRRPRCLKQAAVGGAYEHSMVCLGNIKQQGSQLIVLVRKGNVPADIHQGRIRGPVGKMSVRGNTGNGRVDH